MKIEYAFVRDIKAKSIKIAGTGITCQKQVDRWLTYKAIKMSPIETIISGFSLNLPIEKKEFSLR